MPRILIEKVNYKLFQRFPQQNTLLLSIDCIFSCRFYSHGRRYNLCSLYIAIDNTRNFLLMYDFTVNDKSDIKRQFLLVKR